MNSPNGCQLPLVKRAAGLGQGRSCSATLLVVTRSHHCLTMATLLLLHVVLFTVSCLEFMPHVLAFWFLVQSLKFKVELQTRHSLLGACKPRRGRCPWTADLSHPGCASCCSFLEIM